MTIHHADDTVTLHHGDTLSVLRELAPGSVDCVVTSPPYYGLRDYGTATWDGGDPECDHVEKAAPDLAGTSGLNSPVRQEMRARDVCGRCGAVRVDQQYGLEETPAAYVETMCNVFHEVRRVLADDGTLWLNLGDSYVSTQRSNNQGSSSSTLESKGSAKTTGVTISGTSRPGLPAKNLLGMPWRVAFALQADGWFLRNAIVWSKPNAMPESVTDRLSCKYELVFLLSKSRTYWFDLAPIREQLTRPEALDEQIIVGGNHPTVGQRRGGVYGLGNSALADNGRRFGGNPGSTIGSTHRLGRNPGDVWMIPTSPYPDAHFAVMPQTLALRCIAAGCKPGGIVLDPFSGAGTTGLAATRLGRRYVGIDLSAEYLDMSLRRMVRGSSDPGDDPLSEPRNGTPMFSSDLWSEVLS